MKTFRFLWTAMIAVCVGVCLTACSDDDDDNTIGNGNNGGTIKTENSVTLQTAGTLSLVLGDKVQTITSLKIKGPLNGDDVICIRQMLRCTDEDAYKRGMLTVLDISDASIVAGGDKYDSDYAGKRSTSNNKIGDGMFSYCESLKQIALPNSVTEIGNGAFLCCYGLTSVTIGNSVTEIGVEAFEYCTGLTEITIPNSVTYLSGFSGCTGLTEVAIPESVTEIGALAFSGCTGLTEVTIPESVTVIGDWAFENCTGMTEIIIPNSVTYLSGFSGCTGLTEVTIGNGVTTIGSQAFWSCTGLTSITSLNPEPPGCSSNAFYRVDTSTCVLYVPKESKEAYSEATGWKDFTNIVEI